MLLRVKLPHSSHQMD